MDQETDAQGPPAYHHGRGAQVNPRNRYLPRSYAQEHAEGIDAWEQPDARTQYLDDQARSLVNKVDSPDLGLMYSMNPYQGCEHGCIYCYARNSHQYWGYSAGMDFEHKIIVKRNAPELFRKFLDNKRWVPVPISLSGNTDCYQPAERKLRITRQLLEIALAYRQPIALITKNALVLRDRDILGEMAALGLVRVFVSITGTDEDMRQVLEPRTATYRRRFQVLRELSAEGIPTGVMNAPVIPGINDQEMARVLEKARDSGAGSAGYTIVRLNDAVELIFRDWLQKNFPDRFEKVWHLISSCHGGQVGDSRWGVRMKGEGQVADLIAQQFRLHTARLGLNQERTPLNTTLFRRPEAQLRLF